MSNASFRIHRGTHRQHDHKIPTTTIRRQPASVGPTQIGRRAPADNCGNEAGPDRAVETANVVDMNSKTMNLNQAVEYTGLSKSRIQALARQSEITVVKDGARNLYRRSSLDRFIDRSMPAAQSSLKPRYLDTRAAVAYSGLSEWRIRDLARNGRVVVRREGEQLAKNLYDRVSLDQYSDSLPLRGE